MRVPGFRDRSKRRGLLYRVLMMSLALHAGTILVLAPLVIFRYVFKRETKFAPAQPIERRIDPRKLEAKVKVRETHQKSGRPMVQPRLTAARLGQVISLPELNMAPTPVVTRALPMLQNFSRFGSTEGIGTGGGRGGLDSGESSITFFGVRGAGERIAFVIDVSPSMLEDGRGGINGFNTIKTEVVRMVKGLSPGTFFNIITFSHAVDLFQPEMVLASREMKEAVAHWIEPYNDEAAAGRQGVMYFNYKPEVQVESYRALDGTTRMDLALTAAMEQGADIVFLLTDGAPRIRKELPAADWKAWQEKYHNKTEQDRVAKERERWEEDVIKENQRRSRKGLPPVVVENPPALRHPTISEPEVLEYLDTLQRRLYRSRNVEECRIHAVGYETDRETESFLRRLASENHGRFRRLRSNFKPVLGVETPQPGGKG